METLGLAILAVLFGLIGLVWGADRFVTGSAAVAHNFGISPMVIGLTIVSIGTSAPEIIVSINASLNNAGTMGIGNAIGSNLANIGLVLGLTALICPIPLRHDLLKIEALALLVATLLAGMFLYDGNLTRTEGVILCAAIFPLFALIFYCKKNTSRIENLDSNNSAYFIPTKKALIFFLIGIGVLLVCSDLLVWGAKELAQFFGISQLVVGLTVVAIGTSLPELAASVISAIRGHHDIAIGTIFGSNLLNLLAVMAAPGIIAPLVLGKEVFLRDYLSMSILTLILTAMIASSLWLGKKYRRQATMSKKIGFTLLSLYVLYYAVLVSGS
ncbi:calcium/sodium antiporter [Porticoccus sp. Uisw_050_02]|jgi:cation:H+ antiporter|uniref:calcium/sodium antiporter n=1 Tax=Porticoccus sp. Uisw_050_02 TaxID=3230978 RepID=UPI0039EAA18D|tara:strand:- start:21 stop:1004 length:984 start_codon:yes stop_codon:yes gene_type:complete